MYESMCAVSIYLGFFVGIGMFILQNQSCSGFGTIRKRYVCKKKIVCVVSVFALWCLCTFQQNCIYC